MQITGTGQNSDRAEITGFAESRQPDLLPALQKLREDISRIEMSHPDLKTGLTAVCDEVITWVQGSSPSVSGPMKNTEST